MRRLGLQRDLSLSLQAFLHLLLKISESITRLESLLLIASPTDEGVSSGMNGLSTSSRPDDNSVEERLVPFVP